MYNNAIIQTSYKPYIPPPKKKAVNNGEEEQQPKNNHRVITPNNYSMPRDSKQAGSDTFTRSSSVQPATININQVLIDFNSTLNAIGATEEVEKEVETYLKLVESQSQKGTPNKKVIVSNLKVAADILDTYISETLKKPSKVVKEWVDALLLQDIDFKADANVTKGAFESITGEPPQTAKLAEQKLAQKAQEKQEEKVYDLEPEEITLQENNEETKEENISEIEELPENPQVKLLLAQAKEEIENDPKEALNLLSGAFGIAQNRSDKKAMAEIYSLIARTENKLNNLAQALDCLNASTVIAYDMGNERLKTENHKQMGAIYDEAGYTETALSHYYASLSIDGELDDTANQADTLNRIGKMHTSKYEKETAIDYYKNALALAKVTGSLNLMSDSFLYTAVTLSNAGESQKALNNLKSAAVLSKQAGNDETLASIYEKAGDLMTEKNLFKRAADLYKKSYRLAEKLEDSGSLERLKEKLFNNAA